MPRLYLAFERGAAGKLYTRQDDGTWSFSDHRAGGAIELAQLGCTLPINEVYRKVLDTSTG